MAEAFSFPEALTELPWLRAGFVPRIPGIDGSTDKSAALARLRPHHRSAAREILGKTDWWTAEQVHGAKVAEIGPADGPPSEQKGCDGLMTAAADEPLGIYVADCGAVWLADRKTRAVALLHSGKKGTELGILPAAVEAMGRAYGTRPGDLVAVLGPCIRPPHYEVDFAAEIGRQAAAAGIGAYHDCGLDTAADLERCYSYRVERGKTGRMLALIMRADPASSPA
jgi:copper oxidase (laccase) domain-containing protein